jgi:large subunit ribosomal protein L29
MPSKAEEMRVLPDDELFSRVESAKEELFNLRFQSATGQLDNPSRIKVVRHDIARLLGVLRERHLEAELEQQLARADADALEKSREAQARGEKTGITLGQLEEEALQDNEDEDSDESEEEA